MGILLELVAHILVNAPLDSCEYSNRYSCCVNILLDALANLLDAVVNTLLNYLVGLLLNILKLLRIHLRNKYLANARMADVMNVRNVMKVMNA